ncbi:hypothetical protein CRX72_19490 [Pantoea sp. BRM17]|nr:hypothetical protein CRX72_19490 [Pantoea sp. BRM17]
MLYRKFEVGEVVDVVPRADAFDILVHIQPQYRKLLTSESQYRQLVHADSKFIVNSRLNVKFGLDGMQVLGASAREWVDGGIRLDPGAKGKASSRYPLYADAERAAQDHFSVLPASETLLQKPDVLTVQLSAPETYGIDAGQPLVIYGMKIGQVISRKLDENGINFVVAINPGTLTKLTLLPDGKVSGELTIDPSVTGLMRSGTRIEMRAPKLSLTDTSLSSLLTGNTLELVPGEGEPRLAALVNGAIAFDSPDKGEPAESEQNYQLYPDLAHSQRGVLINLDLPDGNNLKANSTPLMYQGLEVCSLVYYRKIPVGHVYDYSLNSNTDGVTIDVLIERRFINLIKKQSRFWNVSGIDADVSLSGAKVKLELVTPKASLAGVSGLDALVGGNYIGMMPGDGKERDHFTALDTQPKYRVNTGELLIHLHAPDLGSLNTERGTTITINFQTADGIVPGRTPIRYQGVEVGTVQGIELSDDYRSIRIKASIKSDMRDALRENTQFWPAQR